VSVYEDRVIVCNPIPSVSDTKEPRYEQIDEIHLYTGVLYATLTLGIRNDYRVMVRWLPKGKAIRIAALIRERISAA
jgi:hypothetical protein